MVDAKVADDQLWCVLETTQRVTGRRHAAELRFVPAEGGVYVISGSGGLANWCLNLQASEQAVVRIGDDSWLARAVLLHPDDPRHEEALRAFRARYGDVPGARSGNGASEVVAHLVFVRRV